MEEIFQVAGKLFVNVKNNKAFLSNKIGNDTTFSARQLVDAITFIIDNSFITFNGNLYRQVMRIPMGTNCAPYLANMFLHVYEKDFISYLFASGKTEEAMKDSNTFRFQDDLIVMNDNGFSDTIYKDIYPSELTKSTLIHHRELLPFLIWVLLYIMGSSSVIYMINAMISTSLCYELPIFVWKHS